MWVCVEMGGTMKIATRLGICGASLCAVSSAWAAETVTYTYDALGRMTQVQAAGGPASGVQRTYQFDAAGNRTNFALTGAASSANVGVSPVGAVAVWTGTGVVIGVNLSGDGSLTGTVTFTENGVF